MNSQQLPNMTTEISQPEIYKAAELSAEITQQIVGLINLAYSRHAWLFPIPRTSLEDFLDETQEAEIILLRSVQTRQIIATAFFRADETDKNALYVGMVAVDPTQQGKGYAAQLLNFIEQLAQERNFAYLKLTTAKELGNTDYYKRFDFRVIDEEIQPVGTWGSKNSYTIATMLKKI